ncbi:MAG: hypothetical protein JXM70_07655 [Pirellulales bacterium]|nr:hypothetical protein [Pirellulales bacterium]
MPEKERLTKKFAMVLANDIGEETDIPAPDVNTGLQEMAWMSHAWRMTDRLVSAYRQIAERAKAEKTSLRQAAYENAIERVVQVALERGVQ